MKISVKAAALAAAAAAAVVILPASPAHAINSTYCYHALPPGIPQNPAYLRTDLLIIQNSHPSLAYHCFANAGTQDVAIYRVNNISSGNNKVTLWYQQHQNGQIQTRTLEKWSETNLNAAHKVFRIRIH